MLHTHRLGLQKSKVGGDAKAVHMHIHDLLTNTLAVWGAGAPARTIAAAVTAESREHGHFRVLLCSSIDLRKQGAGQAACNC